MHVEWQGDHKLLGDDVKTDFERELTRLGLDPSKFLVEVRREPDLPGADGPYAIRYLVYVIDLEHPDRDTWTLRGGHGENWIAQLAKHLVVSLARRERWPAFSSDWTDKTLIASVKFYPAKDNTVEGWPMSVC